MTFYFRGISGTEINPYPYWSYSVKIGDVTVFGQYFGSLKEAYENAKKHLEIKK